MAVPAGYEASHNWSRKSLTVMCLLLASALAMGMSVYVDSYSVHEWSRVTDIGPVSMSIWANTGEIESKFENITNIDGIEKAFLINFTRSRLGEHVKSEYLVEEIASMDSKYYEIFPGVFQILSGYFPKNSSEIAVEWNKAKELNIRIGDMVNCTSGTDSKVEFHNLRVVGIFEVGEKLRETLWSPFHVHSTIGIVVPELLHGVESEVVIHADVDRTPLTPFNAHGSLLYLRTIGKQILKLETIDEQILNSEFVVRNYLANAIFDYMNWQGETRVQQLSRAWGLILLIILLDFLAIRHNFNERKYETRLLLARGASRKDVDMIIIKEVSILSVIGSVMGLLFGVLLSRIALSATGYFRFEFDLFFSEPFLVTLESLFLSAIVGLLVPFFTMGGYLLIFRARKPVEKRIGKLAKLVAGFKLIRWDASILGLSGLIILSLYSLEIEARRNPYLSTALSILPLVLFVAGSSLTIKAMRWGSSHISKVFERAVGRIPAWIGIRRIGKSASSAAPTVIVLVLAISLTWNMAVIAASLPETKKNHARFAFGGDLTFHMENYYAHNWSEFFDNVSSHPLTEHTSLVSAVDVSISTGYEGQVSLTAIDPAEYAKVGYDYAGTLLNESEIMSGLLQQLDSSASGVIITEYLAEVFDLDAGDTLRASFLEEENSTQVFAFSVLGIVAGLSDASEKRTERRVPWPEEFGKRVMWVNKRPLAHDINFTTSAENMLCVNTREDGNSTEMAQELVNDGGYAVIEDNGWFTISHEVSNYLNQANYSMDRVVDTMISVGMILVISGAFLLYAAEEIRSRKREIALLRSMGAETSHVVKIQTAELLIITLIGMILLVLYSPLMIFNDLLTHHTTNYTFPIMIFVVVPWFTLFSVFMSFVTCMLVLILIIATMNTRINLPEKLNSNWTEGGPYQSEF